MSPYWLIVIAPLAVLGLYALGMWAYRYWLGPKQDAASYAVMDLPAAPVFRVGTFTVPPVVSTTTQPYKRRGFCDECDEPVTCRQHDGRSVCAVHKVQRV